MKGFSVTYKHVSVTAVCCILLMFFSCARVTLVSQDLEQVGMGQITVVVDASPNRSIFLDPLNPSVLSSPTYTFTLTASNGRETLPEQAVTLAGGRGTITNIPDGVWTLTLTAKTNARLGNQSYTNLPVLSGVSTATVQNGKSAPIHFTLVPLKTGMARLELGFVFHADDLQLIDPRRTGIPVTSALEFWVHLYNMANGAEVAKQRIISRVPGSAANFITAQQNNAFRLNIQAGDYRMVLTIKGGGRIPDGIELLYSEDIHLEPGRALAHIITLPRLFTVASAPAGFASNTVSTSGKYNITFSWTRSYNASAYELEVLYYDASQQRPSSDSTWTTVAGRTTSKVYIYRGRGGDANDYSLVSHPGVGEAQWNKTGGLLEGSSSFGLTVAPVAGKNYTARLRAVNDLGPSAWQYLSANLTFPAAPSVTPAAPTAISFTTSPYDAATDSFSATLQWTAPAAIGDVEGYEVQLMRFASGATPRNDAAWSGSGTNLVSLRKNSLNSTTGIVVRNVSGGLGTTDGMLRINIQRGQGAEYFAVRIRSYNGTSVSPWVYPVSGLLVPVSYFAPHTTGNFYSVGGRQVYNANLVIGDRADSACTYQFGWLYLKQGSITDILRKASEAEMDAEWIRLLGLPANNTAEGRGGVRETTTIRPTLGQLNKGVPFAMRVRTVTKSGNAVVDSTPWSYYYTMIYKN